MGKKHLLETGEIDENDWEQTPVSVRNLVVKLLDKIERLEKALVSSSWRLETFQYKRFNKASEFEASPPKLTLFQEYRGLQQELF